LHHAVCVDVVDLGEIETKFGVKHKVEVWWQIDEINPDNRRRFGVRARYTASLHEKAALRQMLETWRGRKFTADELQGFDLEKLIGANCQIQVQNEPSDDGRMWSNVKAVVPAPRGAKPLAPADHQRIKDRPPKSAAPAAPSVADEDSVPF
jgi:hypothetical protein